MATALAALLARAEFEDTHDSLPKRVSYLPSIVASNAIIDKSL